jgi:hypothetical protein
MRLRRREFLTLAGLGALGQRRVRGADEAAALFEEIPAGVSGIRWVHENAMSDKRHLPETMGPGCAFLLRQRRLDGYPAGQQRHVVLLQAEKQTAARLVPQ